MLDAGKSWSGRERNCAFLNSGDGRFTDVSALWNFDLPADSRGLALTDWDQDGDLDVWLTNRTAPGLQFLRNGLPDPGTSLLLKLAGKTGNRDGIGARVEVITNQPKPRLVKSLRAGEGYLSQSSKWLHFGMPENASVEKVLVRWPGGASEEFNGFGEAQRYLLVEGSGRAQPQVRAPRKLAIKAGEAQLSPQHSAARVVAHSRLPLPRLPYFDGEGKPASIEPVRNPMVVNLWATWCAPCLSELASWQSESATFADIKVLCLAVDEPEKPVPARLGAIAPTLSNLDLPFEVGLASTSLLEQLDVVQRSLIAPQAPLPLPCTFLLDPGGNVVAYYKGLVAPATLQRDANVLTTTTRQNHRSLAVPFPGRWYTNPMPPDLLAIPEKLLALSNPAEACAYLDRHLSLDKLANDRDLKIAVPPSRVADLYFRIAGGLGQQERFTEAQSALESSWEMDPGRPDIASKLSALYRSQTNYDEAIAVLRKAISVRPNDPSMLNNLAWLMATHPVPDRRDSKTAIAIATRLCEGTGYRLALPLDTLAAAYAAAGQFEQAIGTAEKALQLVGSNEAAMRDRIEQRLASYRAGQVAPPDAQ